MSSQKLIQQGAEAKIILDNDKIIKHRIPKSYRLKELDEKIRKRRTKSEGKLLKKASEIISIPKILNVSEKEKTIEMEFIDGLKLSSTLDDFDFSKQKEICKSIGESVAKIHDNEIIHGDLTTSNMIFKNGEIFFIDFGLGYISSKLEDKAVDLHVLKQALEAKHFKNWKALFEQVQKGYNLSKESEKVFERLKAVEKRGRYKH
jgi:TP53 regulating kinase-like protein